jgi:hypothetical protein
MPAAKRPLAGQGQLVVLITDVGDSVLSALLAGMVVRRTSLLPASYEVLKGKLEGIGFEFLILCFSSAPAQVQHRCVVPQFPGRSSRAGQATPLRSRVLLTGG